MTRRRLQVRGRSPAPDGGTAGKALRQFALAWAAVGCGDSNVGPPDSRGSGPLATTIEKVSGDAQNGALGQLVPDSLVARVRDQNGNVMSNVSVTWTVVGGGGSASSAGTTSSAGLAGAAWTLGTAPGENALEARVGSIPAARFTAIGVPSGGGQIAFEARAFSTDQGTDIYLMSADGSNIRRIVEHPADDGEPSLSPDGTRVAFKTNRDGDYEIYVANVSGSGLTRLTTNPWTDNNPRWSPDGTKIVFQRFLNTNGRLWIMNADGSGQVAVSPLAPTGRDSKPSWSPDGRRIAFATERYGGGSSIAVVNVDGTGLTRLTERVGDDSEPTWSPDGRFIAFSTDRWGTPTQQYKYDIAVMRPDGSDLRQITRHIDQETLPYWAPDGSKLVYTCWRRRSNVVFSELCSINTDGTGEVRLTPRTPWASHAAWYR